MSATPIGVDSTDGNGEGTVKRQLEALANGECDHIAFLEAMKERYNFEPDDNWEVLSLLDQYQRRGKIPPDVYRAIKNGFAEFILGPQGATPTLLSVATPKPAAAPPPATASRARRAAPAPSAPSSPTPASPVQAPAPAAAIRASAPPTTAIRAAAPPAAARVAAPTPAAAPPVAPPPAAAAAAAADKASAAAVGEVGVDDVLRERYRIEAVLARGSSGTIFEVSDAYRLNLPPAGKRLALKVPRTPDPRGNFLSQLRHEFHQLQLLSHPNIVRVFDFDRDGALSFFTMELLGGVHLPEVLQSKRAQLLPRAYALAIIREVGSTVAYAHSRGVVHGDINPQNVFITTAGEVRLLGFGAAHKLSAVAPAPEFERASPAPDTHRYASCEVFEGNRPTVRDDIYSLSCLAYLLLQGKHPYAETTSIEARATRLRPRRPAGLSYPQWRMLRAGLSTDANQRPDSVQEWLDAMALSGAAHRLPPAKELIDAGAGGPRRWGFLAAAAVLAALIAVGYWFSTRGTAPLPASASEPASPDVSAPPGTAPAALAEDGAGATGSPDGAGPTSSDPTPAADAATAGVPTPATPPAAGKPQQPQPATAPQRVAAAPAAAASAAARTNGITRVEMAVDALDASPTDTAVHVTVHRKGNLHGATSFTWWTESGTAKPGVDFSPVLPHVAHMQDGEASTVLTVPLVPTLRAQAKGFYVGIEANDGGAQLGARNLTQITLPPTDN